MGIIECARRHASETYHGGEPLIFATPPWSLYALRCALGKTPAVCFKISLLLAAVLFFAKLTGLVVFAANVLAVSLLNGSRIIAPISSMLAMWSASGIVAVLFLAFWKSHGLLPADGSELAVT